MSQYAIAADQLPQPTFEGDQQFTGVNLKLHRSQLPPGIAARAENNRFDRGKAAPRPGTRTPAWANNFTGGTLLGSGVYSNPDGLEVQILVRAATAVIIRVGSSSQVIDLDTPFGAGVLRVEVVQQFNFVLLHADDPAEPVRVWDGTPGGTFTSLADDAQLGDGILPIPNPPWSINFLDRAWFPVPGSPDTIAASDRGNYTTYDSLLHTFRINLGTSDKIVGIVPYVGANLIIGKSRSIDLLPNIPADLGDSFIEAIELASQLGVPLSPASAPPPTVQIISTSVGFKSRKCVLMVGSDLLFLSDAGPGGIYRISPVSTNQLGVSPVPASDAIEPLMRRINWAAAENATAEMDGRFAIFFVPIDGSTFNNAALVLDTTTGQWQGVDLWFSRLHTGRAGRSDPPLPNALRIDNVLAADYYGVRRLYAIDHAGARVRLLYEGIHDQLAPVTGTSDGRQNYPVVHLLETRNYSTLGWMATGNRKFQRLELTLETFDPYLTATLLLDENEERELTRAPFIPSRTKYALIKSDYPLSNNTGNWAAPKRGDYSIRAGDGFIAAAPIILQQAQEQVLRYVVTARARTLGVRIVNTGGQCNTLNILLESTGNAKEAPRRSA